ncbi:MAG: hypothetical protein HUK40_19860 [Desulfobacter sp.]|nr:hypothetical protein [Desulfobacter sp.]
MYSVSKKQLSSKAVCQALITARLISSDQARELLRGERQIRETLVANAGGGKNEPFRQAKGPVRVFFY